MGEWKSEGEGGEVEKVRRGREWEREREWKKVEKDRREQEKSEKVGYACVIIFMMTILRKRGRAE